MTVVYLDEPRGPRLRSLSLHQEQLLDNWLTMMLKYGPSQRDKMPTEYTRAIAAIAKRRGIEISFNRYRRHERHGADGLGLGKTIPGCVGGSKRKVTPNGRTDSPQQSIRVRGRDGEFVTGGGEKVAAYNERVWRDDGM